jgi:hypothetical protein
MSKKLNEVMWIKDASGQIGNGPENIENVKNLLNDTGCGFCLAKFTQVTMHLGTGLVHSCHHPAAHKVPVEELANNPGALFNSNHLKSARTDMFNNVKTKECDYCWRVEGNNGSSDRYYKSVESWALEHHDEILEKGPLAEYYPSYLEVDFSNVCNFACIYCGPEFSSKWTETLKQKGAIKLLDGTRHEQWAQGWQKNLDELTYRARDFNPYVDAFWKWFPEAYKHLKVYRITGGEPLMSKETFKSMDWLIENPNPELEFNINSNLGVPDKLWNQFIEKTKLLLEKKSVKRFTVFTSVDGWGKRAEYARVGMDFELFKKRYEEILELGNVRLVIMCTFNILSLSSIKELLEWQALMKRKYNACNAAVQWEIDTGFNLSSGPGTYQDRKVKSPDHFATVGIDMPYLRHPEFLDAQYADHELVQQYLIPAINYMAENTCQMSWNAHQGFEPYELDKFKRVVMNIMYFVKSNADTEKVKVTRAKFYDFITDIDARHGQNFLETFPEMTAFWEKCVAAKANILADGT